MPKKYRNICKDKVRFCIKLFSAIIDGGEKKKQHGERREELSRGRMLLPSVGKYWDVIYGYKYWRSLKLGKRIVEFARESRSFRRNECYLFSFCHPLALAIPDRVPRGF